MKGRAYKPSLMLNLNVVMMLYLSSGQLGTVMRNEPAKEFADNIRQMD